MQIGIKSVFVISGNTPAHKQSKHTYISFYPSISIFFYRKRKNYKYLYF